MGIPVGYHFKALNYNNILNLMIKTGVGGGSRTRVRKYAVKGLCFQAFYGRLIFIREKIP